MMRTQGAGFLCVLAALAATTWLGAAEPSQAAGMADRPNILFILADDYGLDGVGCYGSDRFKTPHLDSLAQSGLRFEACYSTPLCGPTRCLLITGRHGFRTGGLTNPTAGRPLPQDEPSIARTLKKAGYATGHCGKWRQMGATPGDWGFDEYITDPTAGGYYWQKSYTKNGQLVEVDKEVYYPDVAHEFAVDFIRRHREGPFFFYYASHLVHGPILRTPDSKTGAGDKTGAGGKAGAGPKQEFYADNVAYLDKQVGLLVAELDRLNLREKTLILFSADNGTAVQSGTIGGRQIHGAKGSMWEGGARVPLVANWKGTTPQGKVVKDLVDFSDFFATFADVAGAKLPDGIAFDGRSFAPQLRGERGTPREWIFVQLGAQWYVRDPGWKLNQAGDLFDMKEAPFEEKPVSADAQDSTAVAARKRLQTVLDTLNPAAGKKEPEGAKKSKAAKAAKAAKKALRKKVQIPEK